MNGYFGSRNGTGFLVLFCGFAEIGPWKGELKGEVSLFEPETCQVCSNRIALAYCASFSTAGPPPPPPPLN